ncbi:hypothetical protein Cni_G19687 [Canna indica]|uniref:Uncharacterized protein n=1 Tax=Canna indica TaxID=4628 RepID=A0AAQ3KNM7_9LILI|nr:hypothetical protein Cni_G19687 [Canna indica]
MAGASPGLPLNSTSSSLVPALNCTSASLTAPSSLLARSSMVDHPEHVRAFIPNSSATAERAAYLNERCLLVTIHGQLNPQADLAGFLARQFVNYRHHLHLWEQRRLPDGCYLIATSSTEDSYYKRRLI